MPQIWFEMEWLCIFLIQLSWLALMYLNVKLL
jgi:hypothetical protein